MKKTLTRFSIAGTIAEKFGISRKDAKTLLDDFVEEISCCLTDGQDVKLSRFGSFRVRQKSQRPGRNPKTKQPFMINPRRSISFKPSERMKARIHIATKIRIENRDPASTSSSARSKATIDNECHIRAPVPGAVSTLDNTADQKVQTGDVLLSIKTTNVETAILADRPGCIEEVFVKVGDQIDAKDLLVRIGS